LTVEGAQEAAEQGRVLWLAGMNPGALEIVRHSGLAERSGRECMFHNAHAAIEQVPAMPSLPGGAAALAAT
jgi:SulP family sulfate permease